MTGAYDYSETVEFLQDTSETYTEEINGFKFNVSPLAFFQVNSHVFEKML